jgi:hypothetical protein
MDPRAAGLQAFLTPFGGRRDVTDLIEVFALGVHLRFLAGYAPWT